MKRTTRSQSRQTSNLQNASPPTSSIPPQVQVPVPKSESCRPNLKTLHALFTTKSTGLSRRDATLLNAKRTKLRSLDTQLQQFTTDLIRVRNRSQQDSTEELVKAVNATLVFAQEEAGTAICISPDGLIMTCSHCVADDEESALGSETWLVFAAGEVVRAECLAWDGIKDLALLRVIAAEDSTGSEKSTSPQRFPFALLAPKAEIGALKKGTALICIGHPGSEDLEVDTPGRKTGYDVLHISNGHYRGLYPGQNPQDNSEIGALMHDCWTYWGHSGAPLIDKKEGKLVGLHSSWDDKTGMRRGVSLEAVWAFLDEHVRMVEVEEAVR